MKIPKALSPSSRALWLKDRTAWFIRYQTQTTRDPQGLPQALGSAFDGLIKNRIEVEFGLPVRDYSLQVENPAWRLDDCVVQRMAREVCSFYLSQAGLAGLRLAADCDLHLETEVRGLIDGVPVVGKPDLDYVVRSTTTIPCTTDSVNNILTYVMHDWKCNGILKMDGSLGTASPAPLYTFDSKTGAPHKDAWITKSINGVTSSISLVNGSLKPWLDQLATYGLLKGWRNGFIGSVDQITRMGSGALRLTRYRDWIDASVLVEIAESYRGMWESINAGRCFTDLDEVSDKELQARLLTQGEALAKSDDPQDQLFRKLCGKMTG